MGVEIRRASTLIRAEPGAPSPGGHFTGRLQQHSILSLAFEHRGNAHCIVGVAPLVQLTGSGKLFRDPAQRPSHTGDRTFGHGYGRLQLLRGFLARCPGLIRSCLLCQLLEPLQTGLSALTSPSLLTLALTGGAQLLHESRLLELRGHASDLAHSTHLVALIGGLAIAWPLASYRSSQ